MAVSDRIGAARRSDAGRAELGTAAEPSDEATTGFF